MAESTGGRCCMSVCFPFDRAAARDIECTFPCFCPTIHAIHARFYKPAILLVPTDLVALPSYAHLRSPHSARLVGCAVDSGAMWALSGGKPAQFDVKYHGILVFCCATIRCHCTGKCFVRALS